MGIKNHLVSMANRAYEFWSEMAKGFLCSEFRVKDIDKDLELFYFDEGFRINEGEKEDCEDYKTEISRLTHDLIWYGMKESSLLERAREYETEIIAVRRESDDLRGLAQHLKVQNRVANQKRAAAERRVGAFDNFMRERVCNLVECGVHPLTGAHNRCYAFIDRHGKIRAMSIDAQNILGYSDNMRVDYCELIPAKSRLELAEVTVNKTSEELPVRIAEGEHVVVKDVCVSPLIVGDVYAGTIVDFRELTFLEKARAAWIESRARHLLDDARIRFRKYGHANDGGTDTGTV